MSSAELVKFTRTNINLKSRSGWRVESNGIRLEGLVVVSWDLYKAGATPIDPKTTLESTTSISMQSNQSKELMHSSLS